MPGETKDSTHSKMRRKRVLLGIAAVAVFGFVAAAWHFRLYARMVFVISEWRHGHEWKNRSLWLPGYRVVLQTRIEGVENNLSGITWNSDTKTLFAVTNSPARLFELTGDGKPIRRIRLRGFHDTEAVEYVGDGKFIIAEERKRALTLIAVDAGATELLAENALQRIAIGFGEETDNSGLEGMAWDAEAKKLYVAEENPVHIYEVGGFPHDDSTSLDIAVRRNEKRDSGLFLADLSGLDFNARFRHILALSDASKLLVELDRQGDPVSSLSLLYGAGFGWPVPQAEGVTSDGEGTIYLVSEPDLFYVLQREGR